MEERGITEIELRMMLLETNRLEPDDEAGRWRAITRHAEKRWCVIVEPDMESRLLVVVTAFSAES
jgi:hypothetical protein